MWQSWNVMIKNGVKINTNWCIPFKCHLFSKLIIVSRWTAAYCSHATHPPTKLKEGRKQLKGRKTPCYTLPLYYLFRVQTKEELRHSIHIRQNSTFSCAAHHWGAQSSGKSIRRDNTATCSSLLSFQVEVPNVTRRHLHQIANHQGFPPARQAAASSGIWSTPSPMTKGPDLTIEQDANKTTHLLPAAEPPARKVTLRPCGVSSVQWHSWHTAESSPTICPEDYYNEAKGCCPCFLHVSAAYRRLMTWVVKLLSIHNPTES